MNNFRHCVAFAARCWKCIIKLCSRETNVTLKLNNYDAQPLPGTTTTIHTTTTATTTAKVEVVVVVVTERRIVQFQCNT